MSLIPLEKHYILNFVKIHLADISVHGVSGHNTALEQIFVISRTEVESESSHNLELISVILIEIFRFSVLHATDFAY